MTDDEIQIQAVIAEWMRASAAGDLDTILGLMAEDVVFLIAGKPPMRGRQAFAAGFRSMAGKVRIDGKSDIQEIQVAGDHAYCWNHLTVSITPVDGGVTQRREGNVLSVFRKEPDGRWVIWRDANLITEA